MATFSNVSDTLATIRTDFSFVDYSDSMISAAWSVSYSLDVIGSYSPSYYNFPVTNSWGEWWDGTELDLTLSSWGSTSASFTSFTVASPDGAWLTGEGSGKLEYDDFGITGASGVSLKSLWMGNDDAATILNGSIKLDFDTGTTSGRLNSITMGWQDDDPYTAGIEWSYVTLKGSITIGGNVLGGTPSLTGKLTGVEWGTAVANGSALTWIPAGSVSGLTLDASATNAALANGGFESLSAGLYAGNDTIGGTAEDDYLDASTGNDKINGGDGHDEIYGGAGNDQLTGGAGDDYIDGGAGNDRISDDAGDNTVFDDAGNAQITLGAGSDDVYTGAGNDKIIAGDGVNWVESGAGNDNISTGADADFIFAEGGNDKVLAGGGDNWVDGGSGNDTLSTGAGADLIYGGEGADKITGGAGSDVFVFDNLAAGGKDLINDFNAAEDVFAFDTTVFASLAGDITEENLVVGAKAVALEIDDYLIFDTQGGKLYYDADGSGGSFGAIQIAVVKGSLAGLSADNFMDEGALFA